MVGQRRRPVEPGRRSRHGRDAFVDVVPLCAVASRRRPDKRVAVDPDPARACGARHPGHCARGWRAARLPAHPGVVRTDRGLSRRASHGQRWLYDAPLYSEWNCFPADPSGGWASSKVCGSTTATNRRAVAVSAANDIVPMLLAEYINAEFADRPDLRGQGHAPPTRRGTDAACTGILPRTLKRATCN